MAMEEAICKPEAAALKGLTAVSALKAPAPPTWIFTAEDGMSTVFPAVWCTSEAVALVKYAHRATDVRPGFNTQAVVRPVVALPALTAVVGASVKLTVLPLLTVTVSDSDKVAFRLTVPMFEFTCAFAGGTWIVLIAAIRATTPKALFIVFISSP